MGDRSQGSPAACCGTGGSEAKCHGEQKTESKLLLLEQQRLQAMKACLTTLMRHSRHTFFLIVANSPLGQSRPCSRRFGGFTSSRGMVDVLSLDPWWEGSSLDPWWEGLSLNPWWEGLTLKCLWTHNRPRVAQGSPVLVIAEVALDARVPKCQRMHYCRPSE